MAVPLKDESNFQEPSDALSERSVNARERPVRGRTTWKSANAGDNRRRMESGIGERKNDTGILCKSRVSISSDHQLRDREV